MKPFDLFKTDIYSLGITFYKIISGQQVSNINESKENLKECDFYIKKLKMPLIIKQTILHMLAFE